MVRIVGLALVVVWVWSLAESLLTPRHEVRLLPKAVWVIAVVLLGPLGAIGWLALGRPRGTLEPSSAPPAGPPRRLGPPAKGPDDDPDFLRGL
jgi:hypothetical protein